MQLPLPSEQQDVEFFPPLRQKLHWVSIVKDPGGMSAIQHINCENVCRPQAGGIGEKHTSMHPGTPDPSPERRSTLVQYPRMVHCHQNNPGMYRHQVYIR